MFGLAAIGSIRSDGNDLPPFCLLIVSSFNLILFIFIYICILFDLCRFYCRVFGLGTGTGPERAVVSRQTAQVGAEKVQFAVDSVDTHTAGGDAHARESQRWPCCRLARPASTTSAS